MSIRFFEHHEIDKNRWDKRIDTSPSGLIYAYSWYLDIVAPGWCALMDEQYESVMPLPVKKKFGVWYVFPPFFVQQTGIFSNDTTVRPEQTIRFFKAIPARFRYLEMYLHEQCNLHDTGLAEIKKRLNHILPLHQPLERIQSGYSIQLKRNLRKAHKQEIIWSETDDVRPVVELFIKNKGRRSNYRKPDYERFIKLTEACLSRKRAYIVTGSDLQGVLHTGAVILKSHKRLIFIFSGSDEFARRHSLLALLLSREIERHAGSDIIFDFEGSVEKNLSRFYKSFGSLETVYLFVRMNRLPIPFRWFK